MSRNSYGTSVTLLRQRRSVTAYAYKGYVTLGPILAKSCCPGHRSERLRGPSRPRESRITDKQELRAP